MVKPPLYVVDFNCIIGVFYIKILQNRSPGPLMIKELTIIPIIPSCTLERRSWGGKFLPIFPPSFLATPLDVVDLIGPEASLAVGVQRQV